MSSRYLPAMHLLLPVRGFHRTRYDMIGVMGIYYGVTIAVKNDGWDRRPVFENGRSLTELGRVSETALPHCGKCRDEIVGGSKGETRMYSRLPHTDPGRLPPSRRPQRLQLIIHQRRRAVDRRNNPA